MERAFSQKLRLDVRSAVTEAMAGQGIINVPYLAEVVRMRNLDENIAREDVERLIVQQAQTFGAAMTFSSEMPSISLRMAGS